MQAGAQYDNSSPGKQNNNTGSGQQNNNRGSGQQNNNTGSGQQNINHGGGHHNQTNNQAQVHNYVGSLIIQLTDSAQPPAERSNEILRTLGMGATPTLRVRRPNRPLGHPQAPSDWDELYVHHLLGTEKDLHPIPKPSPSRDTKGRYVNATGIRIGDVGIFKYHLPFKTLFNLKDTQDPSPNEAKDMESLPDLDPYVEVIDRDREDTRVRPTSGIKFSHPIERTAWGFDIDSTSGALLFLPMGSTLYSLGKHRAKLEDCMRRNCPKWLTFAGQHEGQRFDKQTLCLVTDVVKCSAWAIAVWDAISLKGPIVSLKLTQDKDSYYTWGRSTTPNCRMSCYPSPLLRSREPPRDQDNQDVFVGGYWITGEGTIIPTPRHPPPDLRLVAQYSNGGSSSSFDAKSVPTGDQSISRSGDPAGGHGPTDRDAHRNVDTSRSDGPRQDRDSNHNSGSPRQDHWSSHNFVNQSIDRNGEPHVIAVARDCLPLSGPIHNPCEAVNRFVLALLRIMELEAGESNSPPRCAISHDDDWIDITELDTCGETAYLDHFSLIRQVSSKVKFVVEKDVVYTSDLLDDEKRLINQHMSDTRVRDSIPMYLEFRYNPGWPATLQHPHMGRSLSHGAAEMAVDVESPIWGEEQRVNIGDNALDPGSPMREEERRDHTDAGTLDPESPMRETKEQVNTGPDDALDPGSPMSMPEKGRQDPTGPASSIWEKNMGLGTVHPPRSRYFDFNYGGDQIPETEVNSRRILWGAIKGVPFSHKAEQQVSHGECLEGTREEVLKMIYGWRVPDGRKPPICWLAGAAGTGKTSIAMTVAKFCEADHRLVESFLFCRSDPRRNNPSSLALAIAHGLSVAHPLVRGEIDRRIIANQSILQARLEQQLEELVLQPIVNICARAADDTFAFEEPTLVVIDGLDECGDEASQSRILSMISSAYQHYPHFPLRFLICSRPEIWIRTAFEGPRLRDITKVITLHEEFNPAEDIKRYYLHEFQDIRRSSVYRHVFFPDPWPSERDLEHLVWKSDGQFAHASAAVGFMKLPYFHPFSQLRLILDDNPNSRPSKSPFPQLDSLYHTVLTTTPCHDQVLSILAAILIIPDILKNSVVPSLGFIGLLLGLPLTDVSRALQGLHSVLDIRGGRDAIAVFHRSFTDYLFDRTRSEQYFIDKSEQHYFLAQGWLQALSSNRIENLSYVAYHASYVLFSNWHRFCASLPGKPTPQLLESLRIIDSGALFLSSLDSLLQAREQVMVTLVGPSNEFSVSMGDDFWSGHGYQWAEKWLESSDDRVDAGSVERFANHPKCFLFQVPGNCDGIGTEDIHRAVRNVDHSKSGYEPRTRVAYLQYRWKEGEHPLRIRITECYCHRSGRWEPTSDHHLLRHACQRVCLQTVTKLVSDLRSIDLSHPPSNEKLPRRLTEMLDGSLLRHCAFKPELFSLCDTFFSYAGHRSSVAMSSDEVQIGRTGLMEWLETCPKSYARKANALKDRINRFFKAFNEDDHS
ncbi:hypothetical protein V5O48_010423 [Marasmius crinis-equi]|uniref:Nephrocystin 3-like N-terminal domain-containing protein n=1 Tax=Marasmius crinis-equi TaxID=585013 RepID=A0ABR3F8G2_9AGAR